MGNETGNETGAATTTGTEIMVGQGGAGLVRIDFFPGETMDGNVARGRFYVHVRDKLVKTYEACGGPPPERAYADRGGHSADPTREGSYVLDAAEHHTTDSWPTSTIPWGARIRLRPDQDLEFSRDDGRTWLPGTGPNGVVTRAWIAFEQRTRAGAAAAANAQHKGDPGWKQVTPAPLTPDEITAIINGSRQFFYRDGQLLPTWEMNDFGNWAWNMMASSSRGLSRTDLYVHTTPQNEQATAANQPFQLTQSHGCVHIRPRDRDEMMTLGYLQKGVRFVVKKYGVKGPAAGAAPLVA